MSIIIKGMKMPKKEGDYDARLHVNRDGTALFYLYKECGAHPAKELHPHGRLIDVEQPIKEIEDAIENIDGDFSLLDFNSRYCMERGLRMAKIFLKTAPTIIEAEEEEK